MHIIKVEKNQTKYDNINNFRKRDSANFRAKKVD